MILEGSLPALYSLGDRVTSRLDLRINQKVITDYKNLGIICILTDLVVSSGYLPVSCGRRRAESCPARLCLVGWATPGGAAHVVCHGYPRSYPPQLVLERLVLVVQRRFALVRAGANKAKQ